MGKYGKYTKKYNNQWEKEPLFRGWLQESSNRIGAYCKICKSELRAHKTDLKKHAETEMHKKNLKKHSLVALNKQKSLNDLGVSSTKTVSNETKIFEIKIAVYMALHSAIRGVDHLTNLIKENDAGTTSQKIRLHRTKCTALIKNVISPALLAEIVNDIGSSYYSIIIDESTDVSVNKYMALCVRFFSLKSSAIKTEYLGMFEVTRATAVDLHDSLKSFLEKNKLQYKNIIGLGTDGASNMVGKFNSLYSLMKSEIPALQLVKCVCHSIHLCSSHAVEELPSNLDFLIRESYNWFAHSALRKQNYHVIYSLINNGKTPLKLNQPSKTRWLSRFHAIDKILNQWVELKTHFEISSVQEKCYSARILSDMYKDDINYLYLIFLRPILKELHETNLLFQSENVNVEVIHDNLKSLIISVCSRILKPNFKEYLHDKKWNLEVLSKTLNNELSFVDVKEVDFGFNFQNKLDELKNIAIDALINLKMRCMSFLKRLSQELVKRVPENLTLLEKLKYFAPKVCLSQMRPKFSELPMELTTYVDVTNLENQYRNILCVDWSEYFPNGNIPCDTIEFWTALLHYENGIKQKCFQDLATYVLNLMAMPISNAVIERVFSVMNGVKTKARNRINFSMLDALLRIRLYCYSRKGCCKDIVVSNEMLTLFTSKMYFELVNEETGTSDDLEEVAELVDMTDC